MNGFLSVLANILNIQVFKFFVAHPNPTKKSGHKNAYRQHGYHAFSTILSFSGKFYVFTLQKVRNVDGLITRFGKRMARRGFESVRILLVASLSQRRRTVWPDIRGIQPFFCGAGL